MTAATDMLAKYLAAEAAILEGKEVRLGDRLLKMEDLDKVQAGRKEWQLAVSREQAQINRRPTVGGVTFSVARFGGE